MIKNKTIVISGINLTSGGGLSVYKDALNSLINNGMYKDNNIIILVHKKSMFSKYNNYFNIMEFPLGKSNWLFRIWYEYVYFYFLSKKISPDVWLSLHDMTPNVSAKNKYVYCHNPSPFLKMSLGEIKYGWKYFLFSRLYKYIYRINIHKNNAVIVQQHWMAKEFEKMFNIKKVIVARPEKKDIYNFNDNSDIKLVRFVYPSFPRFFKNFQLVGEAVKILEKKQVDNFKVYITCNGSENGYAREIIKKYSSLSSLHFCGILSRDKLFELYKKSNCLIFVSKLETWGMPITEFKSTQKPEILADLPYAHETIGNYNSVDFVNVDNAEELADSMLKVIKKRKLNISYSVTNSDYLNASNWEELFNLIGDFGDNYEHKN
ncbi:glycosyltransferase [Limosilactobacillus reuteri]|uniref:Glycosyltransferase n=1 Tax=Limosilactobacillus reuteri TaxID=1598 RepID=A0AAW4X5H5_LIMRT|nr:glycosyltransferase [Limosilactobacillus reuteri]MCC4477594.1 glycosyltransferase [Limosilactobacillus reuteri]MCC4480384.1 glycosyltransferase [Limosilactobacillus reuteri]MCC4488661.1 glycosyltransferase [Limosilactobacillus reuteri]MCC4493951.1 glycosyltransferase [Limosilactobacillus reuteri]MCC4496319.1 glycosyltransferase [Limosilactobacillus reuteri]